MSKVVLDVSMSLDGFIAGPNDEIDPLHDWLFDGDTSSLHSDSFKLSASSRDVLDEAIENSGAVVAGRRTYEVSGGWGGEPPFGLKLFVVTHSPPTDAEAFTFVTEGVETAAARARAAAGGKDVGVMGADVAQQCLRAGLLDEVQIHLVPVLLGEGIRLFDNLPADQVQLETTRVIESRGVTHLRFGVVR